MGARRVVLLTPSKSLYPIQLLSRQQSVSVSPLAATVMNLLASVANKRLTARLNPLDATLTKNRGSRLAHPARMRTLSDYRESKDSSPADLSLLPFPLSPLYSYSFALSCPTDVCQLFWNQLDPHSFPRDGGCTCPAIPGSALSARTIQVRTKG